ncbi:hypothetical protein Aca07nite_26110 [Actinoplanes capillaceus]|uniref:Uncharacterized protein n=1 Tax=Actinoplanes campanulatus TaxID=113559 RepID=A0ABQ3WG57_9ACTN|nr:hypothetical protein Aca07nite_26110 [Actinoplanes capillaceus]
MVDGFDRPGIVAGGRDRFGYVAGALGRWAAVAGGLERRAVLVKRRAGLFNGVGELISVFVRGRAGDGDGASTPVRCAEPRDGVFRSARAYGVFAQLRRLICEPSGRVVPGSPPV